MPTYFLVTLFVLFGACSAHTTDLFVSENVVFLKRNEVSTTRSKWTVTIVMDLLPYDTFMSKVSSDIENAADIAQKVVEHYDAPKQRGFLNIFHSLRKEMRNVQHMKNDLFLMFLGYRTLNRMNVMPPRASESVSSREKRSLLPFVGNILSSF